MKTYQATITVVFQCDDEHQSETFSAYEAAVNELQESLDSNPDREFGFNVNADDEPLEVINVPQ